jgi:cell division protein ZapE
MKIILILNTDTPLDRLYPKGKLAFEFQRTLSRLTEMQSLAYLAQAGKT